MRTRDLSDIKRVIIHCSDSSFGDLPTIDAWHRDPNYPGGPFSMVGYHYVITNGVLIKDGNYDKAWDGVIQSGRQLTRVGAHCRGHNHDSVGVCLIGEHHFTAKQLYDALPSVLLNFTLHMGLTDADIFAHYQLDGSKTCPNIDIDLIRLQVIQRKRQATGGL